jgi:signal transduction histidine kinase
MIRILAIDDNNDNLVSLSATFSISMPEIKIITATNGKTGIKLAKKKQPDVILLDIIMPGMDGFEVCKELKEDELTKQIPIIMLTAAKTDTESKIRALDLGADAFLTKPIEESELMAQIRAMLRIKKAEDRLRNEKNYLDNLVREKTKFLELEISKRIETEENLRNTLHKVEDAKKATLDLMSELQSEISKKDIIQKDLKNSKSQLRELVKQANLIQETERSNISREIHDTIGQALTALKFDLSWIKRNSKNIEKAVSKKLSSMDSLITDTIISVQKLSTELRPGLLDDLGLKSAIEWQLNEFENRTDIKSKLIFENENLYLSESVSVNFFRVMQEALTNVARHAKATVVTVEVAEIKNKISLTIFDNGIGIKEEQISNIKSLGLLGIKERVHSIGGEIDIIGTPNKGTKIIVTVTKGEK